MDPVDDKEEVWFGNLRKQLEIVQNFADEHGKLMAVTETGLACSSADPGHNQTVLHETGNKNLNWYNMVLDVVSESNASYFLLWANFGKKDGYYTPYVDSVNNDGTLHGHETLDGFISFLMIIVQFLHRIRKIFLPILMHLRFSHRQKEYTVISRLLWREVVYWSQRSLLHR